MLGKTQSKEVNSKYPSRNSVGYPRPFSGKGKGQTRANNVRTNELIYVSSAYRGSFCSED